MSSSSLAVSVPDNNNNDNNNNNNNNNNKRVVVAEMHLIITNISKRANVRALIQTAAAMHCASVLVVGQKSLDLQSPGGRDLPNSLQEIVGTTNDCLAIRRFATWEECVQHLKDRRIQLVGVEIHPDARSIDSFLEDDVVVDTAFVMGNEGTGLHVKQMQSCDAFVRIPQYGGGTASLNVYVAASIVLHRFHHWQQRQVHQGTESVAKR